MGEKLQTNLEVVRLYDENTVQPVTKVGVLPFVKSGGDMLMLFMKPYAEAKHLGEPTFQIAKGTRRINVNGNWCDMREDDLRFADESFHETLVATALREGKEEIGLKAENIRQLFDMGGFSFISASRGVAKPIHMFAAEIADKNDFGPPEATTAEARWLTRDAFAREGRKDHLPIVEGIVQRLFGYLR